MAKNKESTKYFSNIQEQAVAKSLRGQVVSASGGGKFRKGDVVNKNASLLCECKCVMTPKKSVSIKKEWIDKNKDEVLTQRLSNGCIAFNFEPDGRNYYVIDERLMKFL